jgi:hypothetical protein
MNMTETEKRRFVKDYGEYFLDAADTLHSKLNDVRYDYSKMIEHGATRMDNMTYLSGVRDDLNTIGDMIYSIMESVELFLDELSRGEKKEGEEDGEV